MNQDLGLGVEDRGPQMRGDLVQQIGSPPGFKGLRNLLVKVDPNARDRAAQIVNQDGTDRSGDCGSRGKRRHGERQEEPLDCSGL